MGQLILAVQRVENPPRPPSLQIRPRCFLHCVLFRWSAFERNDTNDSMWNILTISDTFFLDARINTRSLYDPEDIYTQRERVGFRFKSFTFHEASKIFTKYRHEPDCWDRGSK